MKPSQGVRRWGWTSLILVLLGGCPVATTAVGVAIAATTVTFLLGSTGVLDIRSTAGTTRTAGVVTLPFAGRATDRPASATLNLDVGRTRALPTGAAKLSNQQSLTGAATIRVKLAASSSEDPCGSGVFVGAFDLAIQNGAVSVLNPSIALPDQALEFALSGSFTICLEATATIDVRIEIDQMDIAFGPTADATPADDDPSDDQPADQTPTDDSPGDDLPPDGSDTPTDDPGDTPDPGAGFVLAPAVHVGSEAIIAGSAANPALGFDLPERFNIGRFAMSDDGRFVWFYLFWDSVTTKPADWIRLYRIDTQGGNLQRSQINEEAEAMGGGYLASSRDGSIAVYEMGRAEPAGVFPRLESRFLRLTPGAPAAAFYDTESDAGLPSASGPRITEDGGAIFWYDNENLWRNTTSGGVAQQLVSVAHLNFYGPWDPFTGGQIYGLDITETGSQWLVGIRFVEPSPPYTAHQELIQAAGALPQGISGLPKITANPLVFDVQLSDDGAVYAYEESNAFGVGGTFTHGSGYSADLRTGAAPAAQGAYGQILADSGLRSFVEVNFQNQRTPVFHDLTTGSRLRAGSSRYTNAAGGVYARQLSDDGRTCVAFWNSNPIGTPFNNLYVLKDGVDGLQGHPQFGDIRYRYDAASDSLIVRCTVTSTGGLERIYLLPLYAGVEPVGAVPDAQNPFYNERWGGGVNFSTVFSPVDGLPDTYERVIRMDGKSQFLDGDFQLRIIAVDATGMRTSYRDMVPVR
ncbi:MAG: hypothetical protein IT450_06070 [Phycisphaerales bacterium]|nr:hypothetical protein [Phycisphaerales bacterium]